MKLNSDSAIDLPTNLHHDFQSPEEVEELLLQELESLFDKPCLIPVVMPDTTSRQAIPKDQPAQVAPTSFKIGFEKDSTNTFLITNPMAIFNVFSPELFLVLSEQSQCLLLERLEDILQKCPHNAHILTDHIVIQNVARTNQKHISNLYKPKEEESKTGKLN